MKIMIADDELRLRKVVAMYLKKNENEVLEANSAEQALDMLKEHKVDVIVMDVSMPGMGGLEGCKYLKEHKEYSSIPVVLLTANVDSEDKEKGLEAGADAYVTKPFSPKDLLDTLAKLVPKEE